MRGLEHLSHEKRLGTGPLEPEEEMTERNMTKTGKFPKSGCQEDEARLFPVVPSDRKRGNRHKLEHGKSHVNMSKHIFIVWVTEYCKHAAPRGCRVSFSGNPQHSPGHHPVQPAPAEPTLAGDWIRGFPEVLSNPKHC